MIVGAVADMGVPRFAGRAMALRVVPAVGGHQPQCGPTVPHAGGRLRHPPRFAHPLGFRRPRSGRHALARSRLRRPCCARHVCRLQRQKALAARRPLPVWIASSTVSQISSPLRPTLHQDRAALRRCGFLRGVFIKLALYKPSPLRKPLLIPLMARRRTQGNGAGGGRLYGQQTTVERL